MLVSGGVDSCVLIGVVAKQFKEAFPVYIRSGLRWENAEIYWLKKYLTALEGSMRQKARQSKAELNQAIIHPLVILQMPVHDIYESHWSLPEVKRGRPTTASKGASAQRIPDRNSRNEEVYLPGRNLLLVAKAAVFCAQRQIPTIAMGQLKGNPFPDATPRFLRLAETTVSTAVSQPIQLITPFLAMTKKGVIRLGRRLGLPLEMSFSCLAPTADYRPCGQCNKCAEWERAMHSSGKRQFPGP